MRPGTSVAHPAPGFWHAIRRIVYTSVARGTGPGAGRLLLAFAHIQKTAGVTLNWILRRSFGLRHCEVEPWHSRPPGGFYDWVYSAEDHRRVQRLLPRLESIAGHNVKPFSDLHEARPDVRYLVFLRDPARRTASHYQYAVQRMGYGGSVEDHLAAEYRRDLQTRHIAGSADVDRAIELLRERCFFVGLTERFDESLVLLRQRAARPGLDIRHRRENLAPDNTIAREVLADSRTRALIDEANRADAQLYAWVRDELWPEQVREFGPGLEREVQALRQATDIRRTNLRALASGAAKRLVLQPLARRHQAGS